MGANGPSFLRRWPKAESESDMPKIWLLHWEKRPVNGRQCACQSGDELPTLNLAARTLMSVEIVGEKLVQIPAQQCHSATDKINGSKFVTG